MKPNCSQFLLFIMSCDIFNLFVSFYAYLFVTLHPEKSNKVVCVLKDMSCDAHTCFWEDVKYTKNESCFYES